MQVKVQSAATGRSRREDDHHRYKDSSDEPPYRSSKRKKQISKKGDTNKTQYKQAPSSRKSNRLESRDEGDDSNVSSNTEEKRFARGAVYGEAEAEEHFSIDSSNGIAIECFSVKSDLENDDKSISSKARSVASSVVDSIASITSRSKKKEKSPTNSTASIDYYDNENDSVDDAGSMPIKSTPSSASSVASTITNSVISIPSVTKMSSKTKEKKIIKKKNRSTDSSNSTASKESSNDDDDNEDDAKSSAESTTGSAGTPVPWISHSYPSAIIKKRGQQPARATIRHHGGAMPSIHEEMTMNNISNHDIDDDDIPSTMSEEKEAEQETSFRLAMSEVEARLESSSHRFDSTKMVRFKPSHEQFNYVDSASHYSDGDDDTRMSMVDDNASHGTEATGQTNEEDDGLLESSRNKGVTTTFMSDFRESLISLFRPFQYDIRFTRHDCGVSHSLLVADTPNLLVAETEEDTVDTFATAGGTHYEC